MRNRSIVLVAAAYFAASTAPADATEPSCNHFEEPQGHSVPYDVFMVFFDSGSVGITPETSRILDNVAAAYRPLSHCRLLVTAHADRVGSEAYNVALSGRRARAIVTQLRRRGVLAPADIEFFGETRPLVDTADGVAEIQNRRAEIVIAPPNRP